MSQTLADMEVLVIDCQATGSSHETGHLLEIGWAVSSASRQGDEKVESHLIKQPEDQEIPRQVKRITGISEEDLIHAKSAKRVYKTLVQSARKIAAAAGLAACPTVIHFARYEESFLRHMHRQHSRKKSFPFDIVCSHELVRILLPHLPRKGLRAAAGYLGYSAPELRRSASHVQATAFIWRQMVALLAERQGIATWTALQAWLDEARKQPTRTARLYPMAAEIRKDLPDGPGVYYMRRADGDLLYVGKAASLKKRVNSYFRKSTKHGEHTLEMLTQAHKLDFVVTSSALEAALLESDEIKRHAPPYNVALKEKERRIYFFSPDFCDFSLEADDLFRVGPIAHAETLHTLAAIMTLLEQDAFPAAASSGLLLGIPEAYAPADDIFRQGFALFLKEHREKLKTHAKKRSLLLLGKTLWQRRLEEIAKQKELAEQPVDENPEDEKLKDGQEEEELSVWTPERVCHFIEGIVMRAGHAVRRARWYCLLSESSLAWQRGKKGERREIRLIFERGAVSRRECAAVGKASPLPLPPGHERIFSERRQSFDLITYDRMRVLTTELRRLVSEGEKRNIRLRLGANAILGHQQLERLLQWL